jgi:hypothetical protein
MSSAEDSVRDILQLTVGKYSYDIVALAGEAHDLIIGDRLTIKILSRNIESLTHQMQDITRVTFERDAYREGMEAQKEIIGNLVEERNKLREEVAELNEALRQEGL